MDRDIAIRIDGYMTALGAVFSSAADYIRNNVPDDQRHEYIRLIGKGFGKVVELSNTLYTEHSDIISKELRPQA
jgi:hypothetical protein